MKKALVVDNNEFYLQVLEDFLREEGYQVTLARDGLAALRLAEQEPPDLVLLDLVMPKMDGTKVCRYLKSRPALKDVPVVVLSGVLVEDYHNVQDLGADAFLAKMPMDRLLPSLRDLLLRLEEGCQETLVEGFEGMFRREVVAELLEEKRFRESIISSLVEGAAEVSSDGRILSINPAFAEVVGCQELNVLDLTVAEVLGLDPGVQEQILTASESVIVAVHDRRVRVNASRVRMDGESAGYLVLLEDITDLLRAQEEREALRRKLAQTEKLSALGQMVAGIAHELNNPLTGVIGFTQILQERTEDEPSARNLDKILHEAKRCQEIVANLQTFSSRCSIDKKPGDLNQLLQDALIACTPRLREQGIEVVREMTENLPAVPMDAQNMQRVLVQLIENAEQAMRRHSRQGRLVVRSRQLQDRVQLEIQDNGVGIPQDNLRRIFDPFFSTAEVGEGMGLGLSMAYGILREHGGRILVSSRQGEGATFTMDLPAQTQAAVASKREVPHLAHRRSVLVVDDEPVILDLLVDLLESKGVSVVTAENGLQALEKLEGASYDAVVLDLKMPVMGGRELYEKLREGRPELLQRIFFSTGDIVNSETREFLDDVGVPCIQKPFQIDQVLEVLMGFLGDSPAQAVQGAQS
jgi:PAS domain S-box-containing protein